MVFGYLWQPPFTGTFHFSFGKAVKNVILITLTYLKLRQSLFDGQNPKLMRQLGEVTNIYVLLLAITVTKNTALIVSNDLFF